MSWWQQPGAGMSSQVALHERSGDSVEDLMTIHLRPMIETEYPDWSRASTASYAADKERVLGIAADQANLLAEESSARLLPEGLNTPGHHVFVIESEQSGDVGHLWINVSTEWDVTSAFVYDVEIAENFRGQGFGKASILALEPVARGLGATKIALHVFGDNDAAIGLYTATGFRVTDLSMSKDLC